MKLIRSIILIINYKTLIITSLSVLATWFCIESYVYAEFPLTLLGIAIVFPIVFSINSAYKRRERALLALAEIRGFALGIYQSAKNLSSDFKEEDEDRLQRKIIELFKALKAFLEGSRSQSKELEKTIYLRLDELSLEIRFLKDAGLAGRFVSRLSQYLTRLTVAIDTMKVIFYYRTPRTLRAYSKIFIYLFPLVYAPYFATLASDFNYGLGYVMPIMFSFILVSLDNVQEHLEDPYDQIGEDDIKLDMEDVEVMVGKNL